MPTNPRANPEIPFAKTPIAEAVEKMSSNGAAGGAGLSQQMKDHFAAVDAFVAGEDPVSVFMHGILDRVPEQYGEPEPGFCELTEDERVVFTTLMFDGQVFGCGFDFYFQNINHDHHPYVVKGLRAIGANGCIDLFERAKAKYEATKERAETDWETLFLEEFDGEYIFEWESIEYDITVYGEQKGLIAPS